MSGQRLNLSGEIGDLHGRLIVGQLGFTDIVFHIRELRLQGFLLGGGLFPFVLAFAQRSLQLRQILAQVLIADQNGDGHGDGNDQNHNGNEQGTALFGCGLGGRIGGDFMAAFSRCQFGRADRLFEIGIGCTHTVTLLYSAASGAGARDSCRTESASVMPSSRDCVRSLREATAL